MSDYDRWKTHDPKLGEEDPPGCECKDHPCECDLADAERERDEARAEAAALRAALEQIIRPLGLIFHDAQMTARDREAYGIANRALATDAGRKALDAVRAAQQELTCPHNEGGTHSHWCVACDNDVDRRGEVRAALRAVFGSET